MKKQYNAGPFLTIAVSAPFLPPIVKAILNIEGALRMDTMTDPPEVRWEIRPLEDKPTTVGVLCSCWYTPTLVTSVGFEVEYVSPEELAFIHKGVRTSSYQRIVIHLIEVIRRKN